VSSCQGCRRRQGTRPLWWKRLWERDERQAEGPLHWQATAAATGADLSRDVTAPMTSVCVGSVPQRVRLGSRYDLASRAGSARLRDWDGDRG
jgi:hypothetical protein